MNEWQEFRDNIWWTWENHLVLHANEAGLTKIFKKYWLPRKKFMTKLDAIDLMVRRTMIMPDENRVAYCYGMSKMHIV